MGKKLLIIILFFYGCSCDKSSIRYDLNNTEKLWLTSTKQVRKSVNAYSYNGFTDVYIFYDPNERYEYLMSKADNSRCPERDYFAEVKNLGISSSLNRYSFGIKILFVSEVNVKLRLSSNNYTKYNENDNLNVTFNLRDSGNITSFSCYPGNLNQINGLKFIGKKICRNKIFEDVYFFSIEETLTKNSSVKDYYISKTYGLIEFVTKDSTVWELDYN